MANNLPEGTEGLTYTNPTTGKVLTFRDGVWRDSDLLNTSGVLSVDAGEFNNVDPGKLSTFDYKLDKQRVHADDGGLVSANLQDIQWEEVYGYNSIRDWISVDADYGVVPPRAGAVDATFGLWYTQSGTAWVPRPEATPSQGTGSQMEGAKSAHCVFGGPEGDKIWLSIPTTAPAPDPYIYWSSDTINWNSGAYSRYPATGNTGSNTHEWKVNVWDLVYWPGPNLWVICGERRKIGTNTDILFFCYINHDDLKETVGRKQWIDFPYVPGPDYSGDTNPVRYGTRHLAPGRGNHANLLGVTFKENNRTYMTRGLPTSKNSWVNLTSKNRFGRPQMGVFGGYGVRGIWDGVDEEMDLMLAHGSLRGDDLRDHRNGIVSLKCGLDERGDCIWVAGGEMGCIAYSYDPMRDIEYKDSDNPTLENEIWEDHSWTPVAPRPANRDWGKIDHGLQSGRNGEWSQVQNIYFNEKTKTWIAGNPHHKFDHGPGQYGDNSFDQHRITPGALLMSTNGRDWENIQFFKDIQETDDARYYGGWGHSSAMNVYSHYITGDSFFYLGNSFYVQMRTKDGMKVYRGEWYGKERVIPGPLMINDYEVAVVQSENDQLGGDISFNVSFASKAVRTFFSSAENLDELNYRLEPTSYEVSFQNPDYDPQQPIDSETNNPILTKTVEDPQPQRAPEHGKIVATLDNKLHFYDSDTNYWITL